MMPVGSDAALGMYRAPPGAERRPSGRKDILVQAGCGELTQDECAPANASLLFAKFMALERTHKAVNWGRLSPSILYHSIVITPC